MISAAILIDGSRGEGGGQILRTALSLSAVLERPVTVENIRANRPKPGLRPQHLTVVKALKEICGAEVVGASLDSLCIAFAPGRVRGGHYLFDVGTAGSVTLIAQALLLPLALASGPSRVTLRGGTHVPWSPPYQYFSEVFLTTLARMGIRTEARLERWGWYPKGGGEVTIEIHPAERLHPLRLEKPWEPDEVNVLCASSNLPGHVAEREKQMVEALLRPRGFQARYEIRAAPAIGQGNLVFINARKGLAAAGFSSLGKKGKPAEQVAGEAVKGLFSFLESGAVIDEYLGDQILPYLALCFGRSELLVQGVTSHLRTNLWVIDRFLRGRLELVEEGKSARVISK